MSAANSEIVELTADVSASPYFSRDMAPVPAAGRKWGMRDMAVLWISMSACIPTYMMASSMIEKGMNWWQAVATIFLGNCIVLVPMIANAHAGTRYGIPFPVYCRAAFGIRGANVPALMRALVACGWFGIQCAIGGNALHILMSEIVPAWHSSAAVPGLGLSVSQLGCFLAFWLLNMLVVWRGIDSIRVLLNIKAPLLIGLGLLLLGWAYVQADGFGPMLSKPSEFEPGGPKAGQFWLFFFPALTANVSFWATLSLNIPDFSRYARSQRDQVLGQVVGLPTTMGLYAFIGVAVTSATIVIYGQEIWKPEELLARFDNPLVLAFAMFALCLATLATNIAANVVSPANDFAHVAPKHVNFRIGGLITGVLGILIQPWRLIADSTGYIYTWLIGYSLLLGACGGVLIADYFIIRRTKLDLPGLYRREGPYWYKGGWNPAALLALVVGIAPCLPGFFHAIGMFNAGSKWIGIRELGIDWTWVFEVSEGSIEFWSRLYHYSWFISFGLSLVTYVALMKLTRPPVQHAP